MRLIDADELLKEVIGMKDGWYTPPEGVRTVEDLIRVAPTVVTSNTVSREQFDGHKTVVGRRLDAGIYF